MKKKTRALVDFFHIVNFFLNDGQIKKIGFNIQNNVLLINYYSYIVSNSKS